MTSDTTRTANAENRLRFTGSNDFHQVLRRRVDEYFRTSGRRQRDCWQMYLKTAIILAWFFGSYALLVFWASSWWQAVPLAFLMAGAVGAIGFNVQHDGGHKAYSDKQWINGLTAMTLDMVGGSSYVWRWKHSVFHHAWVNIQDHDADIDLGRIARLGPFQPRLWVQRWQHWYIWFLYGIMAVRWQLYGDFRDLIAGNVGTPQSFPRPRGWDLFVLFAGKAVFLALAFGIPLFFHSFWVVASFYVMSMAVVGVILAVVFQLAHCVEEAEFLPAPDASGEVASAWAIHQIESSVDFARSNRVMAWLLGGLNFQVEHHLFPRICHVHYPALSKLVEQTCAEFGVRYREHRSFLAGVLSHFRWLRRMGQPTPA
jgi:linoleoyl-CoA desaturase